jgi:serine/threonine protein kinase
MSHNQSSSPKTTQFTPLQPQTPLKRKTTKKRNISTPRELFINDIHPTTNLKNICKNTSYHNIKCTFLAQGGFGAIEKCVLQCGSDEIIQSDVIRKNFTTPKPEEDTELDFMIKYCSDATYKKYFAQLLFWYNKSNNLFLGLKQYTCSLQANNVYDRLPDVINNITEIHNKVRKNLNILHRLKYAHLDIKPGNIFINIKDNKLEEVVLGDFGLIRHYTDANIRDTSEGTTWLMLPEPDSTITYKLDEFVKFRDNWAWAISLCYLLNYSDNTHFTWIQYINEQSDEINKWRCLHEISTFVTDKELHKGTKAYLRGIRELYQQHKKIINFIIDQINMLPKFYKSTTHNPSIQGPLSKNSMRSLSVRSPSIQSLSVQSRQLLNKKKLLSAIRKNEPSE